jgi:hypothetical protein
VGVDLKIKARRIIRGGEGLSGEDGEDIPFSTDALSAMGERHFGVIAGAFPAPGYRKTL